MVTSAPQHTSLTDGRQRECFLCTLDPRRQCYQPLLEGRIISAFERLLNGEQTPIVVLDTGTDEVEILLSNQYYRSLIKELNERRANIGRHALRLRVYHLPEAPTSVTYKEKTRQRYQANNYTLAVLEPDILLNITDLNQAEYCPRQHTLNRLSPSAPSLATIRGNLVHHCFKELLKEHDRGQGSQAEKPLEALLSHLEQVLEMNSVELALAHISHEAMRTEVIPHLESLARWYESERTTLWDLPLAHIEQGEERHEQFQGNQVRAETFLLAPEIGLRGRLDLFWEQSGRQRLLELKTGGSSGELPRSEHRWQVYGYHALLTVRRDSRMKRALATLLYSGTPGRAEAFGIPATIREIQRVNERRNALVLSHITGIPPAPPGVSRCTKCSMRTSCHTVSSLLQWQPPLLDEQELSQQQALTPPHAILEERSFFATYYRLLQVEGRAGEQQRALLWKTPVAERIERGTALSGLAPEASPQVDNDGWRQIFRCHNTSELREGDEILLSNGDPITGEVVTGTIVEISSERVTVWTRELIAQPQLLDRYENDLVHVRTLQNLLRWLKADMHLRDLVAGKIRPRFIGQSVPGRADFNVEQNLAVERALQMQDYLLIHGPPGTGKTSVIAEIVKRLCQQGKRVLLAAFTNQAVDNMLKRLSREGITDYLRIGHERSVDERIRPHLLNELLKAPHSSLQAQEAEVAANGEHPISSQFAERVYDLLHTMPIVASTTATWSSDKYSFSVPTDAEHPTPGLQFDVAIIDEAGQLTVPAILGALRFARRFILVGDEKQLPPLVLSPEAAEQGLAASLFNQLKSMDETYMGEHPMAISACVPLRVQYRMNKWISHFSSTVFYEKQLLPAPEVANRKLIFKRPTGNKVLDPSSPLVTLLRPDFPLVFLDVADEQSLETKSSNAEARAVRQVVAELLLRGIELQDIGIIAPYRAQVANIRRHLFSSDEQSNWEALPSNSPLNVDTVDRFQGGERSVIIMSFATTITPGPEHPRHNFLVNPHRLNVALTRAQRKLILVGCIPALEPLPIFGRLIAFCRSMNTVVSY